MLTPGQILQKRRKQLRKSIFVVSQETKIQERFLEYIEQDSYNKFDSGVFVSGFIKIYARYLGLNVDKILALYRRAYTELPQKTKAVQKKWFALDTKRLFTPLNVSIALIALFTILAVAFLYTQYRNFQTPPKLEIVEPKKGGAVSSKEIKVLGVADINSNVTLNGKTVELNRDGEFSYLVNLKEGENILKIEAVSKSNAELKSFEALVLTYSKPVKKEAKAEKTVFNVYLEILSENTWVELIIDEKQKLIGEISPGKSDLFNINSSLQLTTGKPSLTKLYINKKIQPLTINSSKGTGSLVCNISNNNLNCE